MNMNTDFKKAIISNCRSINMPQITFDGVHLGHKFFASVYENSLLLLFNLVLSLCLKDKLQGNFFDRA